MPRIPFYYVLVVTAVFFVLSGARMAPMQAMISGVVSPQYRGGFMNIVSSVQQLAVGLSSLAAGFIVTPGDNGAINNYHIAGFIGIILSLSCIFIARRIRTPEVSVMAKE